MRVNGRMLTAVAALSALAALAARPARAAGDAPKLGWSDSGEFSYVLTSGNSESSTLGLKNTLTRTWERAVLGIRAEAIRAESTDVVRTAVGTPADYVVIENRTSRLAAERYFLGGKYDAKISAKYYWNVGANWERNRFAGIENRWVLGAGVGYIWLDGEDMKFKTDGSLTGNRQEDSATLETRSYAGLRGAWDFLWKLSASTTLENHLVLEDNLSDTADWRADMITSLSVAMSKKLALKVSLEWQYFNQPATAAVALETPPGTPTGDLVFVELKSLNTFFTTSLVVNF